MAHRLSDEASKAIDERLRVIERMRRRNALRTAYYEGEQRLSAISPTIPPPLQDLAIAVGWPKKAVNVRAARIHPEGFRLPTSSELLDEIEEALEHAGFEEKDALARLTALQYGCAFMFSSLDDNGDLRLVVRSPLDATAGMDHRTGELFSGIEQIEPGHIMVFGPEWNFEAQRSGGFWNVLEEHEATGRVTCTVYTEDASIRRPFGQSVITRPVMGLTDIAVRTILRQEVSAEFYSSPQRYLLGADTSMFEDEEGNIRPAWETVLGSLLVAPDHIDEETLERVTPTVGQFAQMSMQPHSDQLRSIAMMFAGETSIPPSRLGIIHDNPSSAEAILAEEADLITSAEQSYPAFARARKSVVLDAAALLTGRPDVGPVEFRRLSTRWRNAATPNLQSQAQSVTMLVQAGILPPNSSVTWELMGFDDSTIRRLEDDQRRSGALSMMSALRGAAAEARADPTVAAVADQRAPGATAPAAVGAEVTAGGVAG